MKAYLVHSCQLAAQHALQLTPLARPQNRGVFPARAVPEAVPSIKPASGAGEAHVGPHLNPKSPCRRAERRVGYVRYGLHLQNTNSHAIMTDILSDIE